MQLFTQTIQNVIYSYIPHETITCEDKNPPWIDDKIKKLVLHKNHEYNAYYRDRNEFQSLQAHLKTRTEEPKQRYCLCPSSKLLDNKTSPKSY